MKEILKTKPPLFRELYNASERTIVSQGGTSSGKTFTQLDVFFLIGAEEPNSVITIVGQDVPNLKKGAFRDAKKIWADDELWQQWYERPNETDRVFKCKNGSIIEFNAYQDEQDARSGKRDYLFINEANGIRYEIFWQLQIRTRKRVYLDYNPTARFWAHDLHGNDDVKLIISDHRHNTYLSKEEHERIEGIKDKELFRVYARGLTGKIEGLIYKDWSISAMPDVYKKRWIGLDFGFTNDPTAILDIRLSDGQLWVDEIAYSTGLLNSDIASILEPYKDVDIIADSAEPKSIAELRGYRLKVEGAEKGADSIKNGIDILKRYHINITSTSSNLKRELMGYKWADNRNGGLLNKPIDEYNHALDALRYVALNKLNSKPKARGVIHATY